MSKILATLLAAIAITAAHARENITILYAYSAGDSVANYHRTIAAEANKIQDRYNFVFDAKPGAGGAIASNQSLGTPNTILAHSTAFFVRPVVFPNESYDIARFRQQYVHCMAPMAVTSSRYRSWKDVPANATVGISGLGVTTHLAAIELKKKFPDLNIIPFKSTTDSMLSMVGGQTDLHIGFISEAEQWSRDNATSDRKVSVLGITGNKTVNGYTPLAKLGFDPSFADMNVGHHMVLPVTIDDTKRKDFYEIFAKVSRTDAVRAAYAVDYCEPQSVKYEDLNKFFAFHAEYWRKLAGQVKLDNK